MSSIVRPGYEKWVKPHWTDAKDSYVKALLIGEMVDCDVAVTYPNYDRLQRVCLTPVLTRPRNAGHD